MKAYSRSALAACGLAIALAGCGNEQPQSTASRNLVSGITASSGGGMEPANFGTLPPTPVSARNFDTGNMAYPEPLAQGRLGTTNLW